MITRAILEAQKELFMKGQTKALADYNAFRGAIECIDNFLRLEDQYEEAHKGEEESDTVEE